MTDTFNVQDWIHGKMESFAISDNGTDAREPVVVAEVFVNEDLDQTQEEAEAEAAKLANLFANAPELLETLQNLVGMIERDERIEMRHLKPARNLLEKVQP